MHHYRVKDYNHIQGMSFAPDRPELLAIGGYEAQGWKPRSGSTSTEASRRAN